MGRSSAFAKAQWRISGRAGIRAQERLFSTPVLKHPDHPAASETTPPLWNVWKFSGIFPDFYRDFFVFVPHLAHSCFPKSNCWGVSVSLKLHKQTLGQKPSVNRSCSGGIRVSHSRLKSRNPNWDTALSLCHPRQGLTATHNPTGTGHNPFAWHKRRWCLQNQTALWLLTSRKAFSAIAVLLLTSKGN